MSNNNTDTGDTIITTTEMESTTLDSAEAVSTKTTEPRESMISTAVNFLQNSKVRHTTLLQKQQFLRSKGLTAHEIQLACERAGVFTQDPNSKTNTNTVINMGFSSAQMSVQPQQSVFGKLREILHSTALVGALAYAIYIFWKKYIEPFLFGKKKKKPIDVALEEIDKKVDSHFAEMNTELGIVKESLEQHQRDQSHRLEREFNNFRSDLEAIKGLLLNRKQFASPMASIVAPPLIPAWQLASSPRHHHHRHSQSDDNEKADDAGSGSGSSEPEVVTKNSDSSLEIM